MSKLVRGLGIILALSCSALACAHESNAIYKASSLQVPPAAQASLVSPGTALSAPAPLRAAASVAPAAQTDCELRMLIEQQPGGGTDVFGYYEIAEGNVGAMVVERLTADDPGSQGGKKVANGVCIKRVGEGILLPADMLIATQSENALDRFCRGDPEAGYQLISAAEEPVAAKACIWNGIFHAARPFTITLITQRTARVADFVEYLRVFRNGDLMAAWNRASDSLAPWRVVVHGKGLTSGPFAVTQPPHLSAMDIRIIPRDDEVTHTVELQVRNDLERFEARLLDASEAALDAALPRGSNVRTSLDCLRSALKNASRQIIKVVNGEVQVPQLDPACHPLIDAGGATPLSTSYSDLKQQSAQKVDELRTAAANKITTLKQQLINEIPNQLQPILSELSKAALAAAKQNLPPAAVEAANALDKCIKELDQPGRARDCLQNAARLDPSIQREYDRLSALLVIIDKDITEVLATADEAHLLAKELTADVKEVLASTHKQAQIFAAFTQSLQSQGTPFEPRRDNPTPVTGELKIDMAYADRSQVFILAPWNAVPLRLNRSFGPDFNGAVAVPLLDVVGFRYQWSRSRFADFRVAAGIGYTETELVDEDAVKSAVLPNVSVGLGTVKVGFGVAFGGGADETGERMRLLIGLDLYKLIAGSNLEVL